VCAIVSSGYSNDLVLSNYQAHGFRGMVSKPYEIADLAHAIERVLRDERA
jgi:CheY-like chemotaxis protein